MKESIMKLQLDQTEIEKALSQYIQRTGIDLRSKSLTIDFTAGRKAGGLIADLIIEDVVIPGFTEDAAGSNAPVLTGTFDAHVASVTVVDDASAPVATQAATADVVSVAAAAPEAIKENAAAVIETTAATVAENPAVTDGGSLFQEAVAETAKPAVEEIAEAKPAATTVGSLFS